MIYAVLSDIHANRQALKAVLTDIRANSVDQIICLGDIVGYGPSPAETLEMAQAHIHHFVIGNHDAVVAGMLDPACFNDQAREIIQRTAEDIHQRGADFLAKMPLSLHTERFACSHGNIAAPDSFGYVFEPAEAEAAFKSRPQRIIFTGHSHAPGVFVLTDGGPPYWLPPTDFRLEDGKRYIVNVGSVGLPRDNDIRSCHCLFDDESGTVVFRKVPFDLDELRRDIHRAGYPEDPFHFLTGQNDATLKPIRECQDFHPHKMSKTAGGGNDLELEIKHLKRTRNLVIAAALTTLFVIAVCFALISESGRGDPAASRPVAGENSSADADGAHNSAKPAASLTIAPRMPATLSGGTIGLLDNAGPGLITPDNPLTDWRLTLDDSEKQKAEIMIEDGGFPILVLKSGETAGFRLESMPVMTDGGRFSLSAQRKGAKFETGQFELIIESSAGILARSPLKGGKDLSRWTTASTTMPKGTEVPSGQTINAVIKGEFKGLLRLRRIILKKRLPAH